MANRDSEKTGKTSSPVLLLRFSAMGDVAMTAAVVREFAIAHPQQRFIMVSRPLFAPLFEGSGNVSFVPTDFNGRHKGFRGLLRLFRELRRSRPAVVADMHDVLRTKILRCLFRLSGTPVRVIDKGRREKRALTRRRHKKLHPLKTMHERYWEVLAATTGSECLSLITRHPSLITRHPSPLTKKIGIAPFAKYREKIYPPERMEKIIAHFAQMEHTEVYLFGGGKAEEQQLAEWESKYPSVTSLAGKLPFSDELFHLGSMDVVISMDSANMHLASFMGVPVVSVWGATHPYAGFTGWRQPPDYIVQIDVDCRPCSVFGNKPCYRKGYVCMNISEDVIIEKVMNNLRWKSK